MATTRGAKLQADDVREDIADAVSGSAEDAREELRSLRARLRANGAQLEDDLREARDRFTEGARTFRGAAEEQVREHPLASFGVAFLAGVVASRLLRRH
jgi:ElaB/YqjD/DUF883 family membrane-anchored ribosome-binding protein